MDAKITLSFDEGVINKAKAFAESRNISLSRLTEFLYGKITNKRFTSLEDLPLADWVNQVSEGKVEYKTKSRLRKEMKAEFFSRHK